MLKIRLMRIGGKKRPFYRVVVVEERSKRTGSYVELLGTYNPLTEPKDIKLKQDRIDYWIKQGAQPSVGYLRIIGKAKQRPPRKPKKEKKEEPKSPVEEVGSKEPVKEEAISEEPVKASESEAVSEVQSASDEGTPQDSASEQTHSEAQNTTEESQQTEPSGASTADEPAPVSDEGERNEGSA